MLSVEEYKARSRVDPLPEDDEIEKILSDAEDDINTMTFNRILARGFDALTPFQQEKVKSAISKQTDFKRQYGDLLTNPLSSYGINGVSMSWDKSVIKEQSGIQTCSDVVACLIQTGLMYRGVIG